MSFINWNVNTIFENIIYSFQNQFFKLIDTGSRGTLRNSRTPTWLFRDNDTTHYKVIMIINVNRLLYDHSHRERWWRWWSFCTGCPRTITFPLSILAGQESQCTMYKCLNVLTFLPPPLLLLSLLFPDVQTRVVVFDYLSKVLRSAIVRGHL